MALDFSHVLQTSSMAGGSTQALADSIARMAAARKRSQQLKALFDSLGGPSPSAAALGGGGGVLTSGARPAAGGSLGAFLNAVKGQESGGRYDVVNDIGAVGAYQVMPGNIGPWTQAALGRALTPAQFRASPAAQEAVARWRLGSYVNKYGYRGAAAAWYSGNPNRQNDYSHVGNGPSVAAYVDQVMARMRGR